MSRQQDLYLGCRGMGFDVEAAAERSGILIGEAHLIEKDIARGDVKLPTVSDFFASNEDEKRDTTPPTHNQEDPMSESIAADELRLLIERIERLEEEKQAIADDVKDVYKEAKSRGYDTRTIRECVKLRKLETHVRQEREALLETYRAALGMDYAETPLGRATVERAAEMAH